MSYTPLRILRMNRPRQNNNNSNNRGGSQNSRNRNRKRNNNRRRSRSNKPKLPPIEQAYKQYLNLLERHLQARKKYYELFHRADPRQLAKLERLFYKALDELRNFEDNLEPKVKEDFIKRVDGLKLDTTYSSNREIEPVGEDASHIPGEEPHFLTTQEEDFSNDNEESIGSMEDYYSYKGIEPPMPAHEKEAPSEKS